MSTDGPARRLRSARRILGLNIEDVAAAVGITAAELGAIESGERAPTAAQVTLFARLFRRSEEWVRGEVIVVPSPGGRALCAANLSAHDQRLVEEFANFLEGN